MKKLCMTLCMLLPLYTVCKGPSYADGWYWNKKTRQEWSTYSIEQKMEAQRQWKMQNQKAHKEAKEALTVTQQESRKCAMHKELLKTLHNNTK